MTTSVVICAYADERWDDLVGAVESVRRQSAAPLEVIVAVDHNPRLFERARTCLPGVKVVENREARGLSGARNSGIAATRGDVVAFLDDDAAAEPEWLARLGALYHDPHVLGVGGAIDPRWLDGRPSGFPRAFDWVVGCTYEGMPTVLSPVRNLIGANMSLRREVFERVGGFRSGIGRVGRLPVGCEETELCIRARQQLPGGVFIYEPRARVEHSVPAGRATWGYFCRRCFAEGLSKARVSAWTGRHDALASERSYVRRTIPAAVRRELGDALRGDASGLIRAAALVAGLAITSAGYLTGELRRRAGR
ncbi:MAG: glycosyltransferase [Actinomycetota bacterium]|nr:glycosyltransferase [Actinomycetota bacterium]